jgi:hypothetical protein
MTQISFDIGSTFLGSTTSFLYNLGDVGTLVSILLNNAIVIAGVIFLFLIILAGYNILSAAGNPQKMQQSMQIITSAIIGFILVIASYLIVKLIEVMFSVRILS